MSEYIAEKFKNPLWINLIGEDDKKQLPKEKELKVKNTVPIPTSNIQHFQIKVDEDNRFSCLIKLLTIYGGKRNLVFVNSISLIQDLGEYLRAQNIPVELYHSQLDAKERKKRLGAFLQGYVNVLLCTDLILSEVDILGCNLSIQYRLPNRPHNYLHRVWKMGSRKDPYSTCNSFILHFKEDNEDLLRLKSLYLIPFKSVSIPSDDDYQSALLNRLTYAIKNLTPTQSSEFYKEEAKKLLKEVDPEIALGNALQLLSNTNQFNYSNFQPLPRSVRARLEKKKKFEDMKVTTSNKKKQTKHKLKLVNEFNKWEKE